MGNNPLTFVDWTGLEYHDPDHPESYYGYDTDDKGNDVERDDPSNNYPSPDPETKVKARYDDGDISVSQRIPGYQTGAPSSPVPSPPNPNPNPDPGNRTRDSDPHTGDKIGVLSGLQSYTDAAASAAAALQATALERQARIGFVGTVGPFGPESVPTSRAGTAIRTSISHPLLDPELWAPKTGMSILAKAVQQLGVVIAIGDTVNRGLEVGKSRGAAEGARAAFVRAGRNATGIGVATAVGFGFGLIPFVGIVVGPVAGLVAGVVIDQLVAERVEADILGYKE